MHNVWRILGVRVADDVNENLMSAEGKVGEHQWWR